MTRRELPPTNVSPSGSVTRYRDRILIEDAPDGVVVTTTDVHLPQRIAKSLKHAYHGDFEIRYGHDEYTVRVNWRR